MVTPPLDYPSDAGNMRLAHPQRAERFISHMLVMAQEMAGPTEWRVWERGLKDTSRALADVIGELADPVRYPKSFEFLSLTSMASASTDQGGPSGLYAWIRHHLAKTPHFVLDDALVELLELTDLTPEVPVSSLMLPYPSFYLEFGRARSCSVMVPNAISGDHILEGGYVERGHHADLGEVLYVVLTGSPLGKNDVVDDATLSVVLRLDQPEVSLEEAIRDSYEHVRQQGRKAPYGAQASPDRFVDQTITALNLVAKALLYIALPETRRSLRPERTDTLAQLSQLKSPGKRAKVQRRADRVVDYVLIEAQPAHQLERNGAAPDASGRAVRAHWRRGHYRMQAHGERHALRKLVFIRPMLVAAGAAGTPDAPDYRVR